MLGPDPELAVAYGIFSVRQARHAGYRDAEIRRLVARGSWRRSNRGLLEVVGREPQAGDDLVRDLLRAGPGAVIGFAAAASAHGWDLPALPPTPKVILPPGARDHGVLAYRARLGADEVCVSGVALVTRPHRTAIDLATALPLEQAVTVADSALRSKQVRLAALQATKLGRRVGADVARQAFLLADPLAGSVAESEARMLFRRAGFPPPLTQYRLRLDGLIAVVDFAWPAHRTIVEIDGRRWHIEREAFQLDRTRQNALIHDGWCLLRFTVGDIRNRPDQVIGLVDWALSR